MRSIHNKTVKEALDTFWQTHRQPPTIRDLQQMTGIGSSSHIRSIVFSLEDVRVGRGGKVIPKWVDELFDAHLDPSSASREKYWQETAGKLASIANFFYHCTDESDLSDNDIEQAREYYQFLMQFLEFDEEVADY